VWLASTEITQRLNDPKITALMVTNQTVDQKMNSTSRSKRDSDDKRFSMITNSTFSLTSSYAINNRPPTSLALSCSCHRKFNATSSCCLVESIVIWIVLDKHATDVYVLIVFYVNRERTGHIIPKQTSIKTIQRSAIWCDVTSSNTLCW